jgi:sensor histidine kinase regulating citrate/malate metabolism
MLRNTLLWLCMFILVVVVEVTALIVAVGSDHKANDAKLTAAQQAAVVARREATRAVNQAQAAEDKANQARKIAGDQARRQFCVLIRIGASDDPPPTTARGFAQQDAYKKLEALPLLHCDQP